MYQVEIMKRQTTATGKNQELATGKLELETGTGNWQGSRIPQQATGIQKNITRKKNNRPKIEKKLSSTGTNKYNYNTIFNVNLLDKTN